MTVRDATKDEEADMLMWTPKQPVFVNDETMRLMIGLDEGAYMTKKLDPTPFWGASPDLSAEPTLCAVVPVIAEYSDGVSEFFISITAKQRADIPLLVVDRDGARLMMEELGRVLGLDLSDFPEAEPQIGSAADIYDGNRG